MSAAPGRPQQANAPSRGRPRSGRGGRRCVRARLVRIALLMSALLAGCGGGSGGGDAGSPSPAPAPAPSPDSPPPPPPPSAPAPAPAAWSTATIGGGGAALYGCDSGAPLEGFSTYRYVRAGAANGNGSRAQPFGSVQAAYASVGSGQRATICVEEGSYTENVGAEPDDMARGYRLVGAFAAGSGFTQRHLAGTLSRISAANASQAVLRFGNHGEIVVDGFDLSGGLRGLYVNGYAAGRKLAVRNNLVHHNGVVVNSGADLPPGASENSIGGVVVSGSDVLVEYNEVHSNDGAHNGAGLNIGGAASSESNRLDNGTLSIGTALARVRYNRIHHNTLRYDTPHGAGITLNMNARVERNLVWANQALKWNAGGGEGVGGGLIAQSPNATVTLADNWFEGNRALKAGAGFFFDEASIATAYNNVVVNNDGESAICVDGRAGGNAATDRSWLTLVHNTIALNAGAGVMVQDSTLHAFDNLFWHNGAVADLTASTGGAQAEALLADRNAMKGSYGGLPGFAVTGAVSLEAAQPFTASALLPFGQLSVASVDLRPTAAVGSDTRWTFPAAFSHTGALTQAPAFDADAQARPAGAPVQYGAYQRP